MCKIEHDPEGMFIQGKALTTFSGDSGNIKSMYN